MSRVYEYNLEMEELAQDSGWQEWQEQQEIEMRADMDQMDNMEENKALSFAIKIANA